MSPKQTTSASLQGGEGGVPDGVLKEFILPPLREDLLLHPGGTQRDGSPSWIIEDPARGRYFRIGWLEFEALSRWELRDARLISDAMTKETLLAPSIEEILAVKKFLSHHELILEAERLAQRGQARPKRPSLAKQALHHYLMFRVPLINPDRLLAWLLPSFGWLLTWRAFLISLVAGVGGILLTVPQWDHFKQTFIETLSWQGLTSYLIAVVCAKIVHEFAHALTAKRLGLRVPRMGVAIVLLLPMLYTDTSETWRLTRRSDRFAIAAAGLRIEFMLAAWCTLFWAFLPDGTLRGAMFFLATTSWVITLAINASPFMRFDGYYMLSDLVGIPNLHDEASRVVKYHVRNMILGFRDDEPLIEGRPAPSWLLWFGIITIIYRFMLFLGIAITVYHYFFKLLGIILFAVEIWWFILRPFQREMVVWWQERERIEERQRHRLLLILSVIVLFLITPWQGQILADGWVRSAQEWTAYSPRPARLIELSGSKHIEQNVIVAELESSELQLRGLQASARIDAIESRLLAATASDQLNESTRSTREQLQQQITTITGADLEAQQLKLTSPFSGVLVDVPTDLASGLIVGRQDVLGRIINPTQWIAEVFVDEEDVKRLHIGNRVKAYLKGYETRVIDGVIDEIDPVPVEQLPVEMLAARFGGTIVTTDDPNVLKPRDGLFRVRVALVSGGELRQARLAGFNIEGDRVSILGRILRGALGALVLQANF